MKGDLMSAGKQGFESTADTSAFKQVNHNMYNNYINGTATPNVHEAK